MERLTEYDLDIGYYVEEDMANQEATSNIDGRTVIQGEAITKLAELENMIEEGELVQVVRCMDCRDWNEENIEVFDCTFAVDYFYVSNAFDGNLAGE